MSNPALATARRLAAAGQDQAAMRAFLELLRADPASLDALTDLARLALRGGHRSAARTAYLQAIFCHPDAVAPRVNLGALLIETGEFEAARDQFAEAARLSPGLAAAHQGLARVLTAIGDPAAAAPHWERGFARGGWLAPQPYHGTGEGVRLLVLVSARGGNIPTRSLLDDTIFAVTALYAEHYDRGHPLPAHQLIFNAIGDADLCGEALAKARQVAAASSAPMINPPGAIELTGRAANAARFAGLADVETPSIRAMSRADLLAAPERAFPLLVRSPGFNTGQHFVRVERAGDLAAAIADLPGDELLAIQQLDCRGADGLHRKYRAMLIGGAIYPLHLAISTDWKVHYFSAAMADSPHHRAEEAAFLSDMPAVVGRRAVAGLQAIAGAMHLDYAGVDFALAPDGRLRLFEANAGMVIHPPGPEPMWDYRRAPIARALAAVKALLLERAAPMAATESRPFELA